MKKISKIYIGSDETKKLASALAKKTLGLKGKRAIIFALAGNLGSGKTTFAQGFIKSCGVKIRAISPTFLIFKIYKLPRKTKNFKRIIHADLYRLNSKRELNALGFQKLTEDKENIILIEWADKIKKSLPKNVFWVKFEHYKSHNKRKITIT